ncbi:MAG: S1 family peptidase [Polyangiaceae bacterium]
MNSKIEGTPTKLSFRIHGTLALGAVLVAACSAGAQGDGNVAAHLLGTSEQSIQGGSVDSANKYPYAVGIYDTAAGGICSGALIAPNLVLTARHCVAEVGSESVNCDTDEFGATTSPSNLVVTTDNAISQTAKIYRARKVFTPPATKFCGNDIALIMLSTSVPATEATPIVPAVYAPITDHSKFDMKYTAIGYGVTAPNSSNSAGTRRFKENISIQCIPGDALFDCGDLTGAPLTPNEFVAGAGTCQGDSGSSAYEQKSFTAGAPISLGVLSRGGSSRTQCMDAIYTRVDSWRDLVISAAVEAAQTGNYTPPSWTNSTWTPPPTPDAGTPTKPDAGSTTKPTKPKDDGAACSADGECASGYCLDDGQGGKVCDAGCTVDADCGEGSSCVDQRCVATSAGSAADAGATQGQPVTTTTTTTVTKGCSMHATSDGRSEPVPWFALGLGAFGVAVRRRRRSS